MQIILKITSLLLALILLSLQISCNSSSGSIDEYKYGKLFEIQKEVPFIIVMPKYLPENIRSVTPSFQDNLSNTRRSVSIMYEIENNNNYILIEEGTTIHTPIPSTNSSVFLDIKGTRILEETSTDYLSGKLVSGFRYDWNNNPILCTDGLRQ